MGWWWWLQTDLSNKMGWWSPMTVLFFRVESIMHSILEVSQYLHQLGPVKNETYWVWPVWPQQGTWMSGLSSWILDELWWTLEFKSRCSFPHRRTVRRLQWKECRPGAWDSEQSVAVTTSNHIDTSTYRHGMSQAAKHGFEKVRNPQFKNVKTVNQRNWSVWL